MNQDSLRLVAFSGSKRAGSFNQAILDVISDAIEKSGIVVDRINLADFPMPIFDQDLETSEGIPETVRNLKKRFAAADGFLIASPEYNSAFTPLMKNVIDWCSRAESEDEPPLSVYRGKSALLVAASPGGLGGIRGLYALRSVFQNIGVTVFPSMLAVGSAYEVISKEGEVTDEKWKGRLEKLAVEYSGFAQKLQN